MHEFAFFVLRCLVSCVFVSFCRFASARSQASALCHLRSLLLMVVTDDIVFHSIFLEYVVGFLPVQEKNMLALVCSHWNTWLKRKQGAHRPRSLRPLQPTEVEDVVNQLKRLQLPWSRATEDYVTGVLSHHPSIPEDFPHWKENLCGFLTQLYSRAILPPKTNIGTLDTTRVIERLTQARLSRFHSTSASLKQKKGH